ncbi:MAG: DUF4189 domain-containing protein [Colwellia sp.]
MKIFTVFSALSFITLLSSCSSYLSEDYTNNNIEQSIFALHPVGSDAINSYKAFSAYTNDYKNNTSVKAFAFSDNGTWGIAINQKTAESAKKSALNHCQENRYYKSNYPCSVINVNGDWLKQPNKTAAILATIPKWLPPKNVSIDDFNIRKTLYSRNILPTASDEKNHNHSSFLDGSPPVNYSPSLRERHSAIDRNYASPYSTKKPKTALAKSIWLYEHGDKTLTSQFSNKLMPWITVARSYPPAKVLLTNLSEHIKQEILANPNNTASLFSDYYEINIRDRSDKVVELYQWLDKQNPQLTKKYYPAMQKHLM